MVGVVVGVGVGVVVGVGVAVAVVVAVGVVVGVGVGVAVVVGVAVAVGVVVGVAVAVGVAVGVAVAVAVGVGDLKRFFKRKEVKMDLDNLTIREIKQIKQLNSLVRGSSDTHPYQIGKNYFIRTVTHHYTGRLTRVTSKELVLEDAAWIADDGRFMNCIKEGKVNEVEPFCDPVIIGRGAIIDATVWNHALPREQK